MVSTNRAALFLAVQFIEKVFQSVDVDGVSGKLVDVHRRVSHKPLSVAYISRDTGLSAEFIAVADIDVACEAYLTAYAVAVANLSASGYPRKH